MKLVGCSCYAANADVIVQTVMDHDYGDCSTDSRAGVADAARAYANSLRVPAARTFVLAARRAPTSEVRSLERIAA